MLRYEHRSMHKSHEIQMDLIGNYFYFKFSFLGIFLTVDGIPIFISTSGLVQSYKSLH